MICIEAESADEVWRAAASMFEHDQARLHAGRAGPMGSVTLELLHVALTVRNPRERWTYSRRPPMNPAFALAEVLWIVNGRNDSAFINYWNSLYRDFAGTGETYHGAYGHRLRRHFGIDQLRRAAAALRANPEGRQVVLQIWDPTSDLPHEDGRPVDPDVPCNLLSILKVREGRLEWLQVLRSNDLFLGVPHNFVQFMTLQEILAGWVGVDVGTYTHVSDSLHVYEKHFPLLGTYLPAIEAEEADDLRLPEDPGLVFLRRLESRARAMTSPELSIGDLEALAVDPSAPDGYADWLLVLAADAARRHQWADEARRFIARCSNPVLRSTYERWHDLQEKKNVTPPA